jgi:hypothetical protein
MDEANDFWEHCNKQHINEGVCFYGSDGVIQDFLRSIRCGHQTGRQITQDVLSTFYPVDERAGPYRDTLQHSEKPDQYRHQQAGEFTVSVLGTDVDPLLSAIRFPVGPGCGQVANVPL